MKKFIWVALVLALFSAHVCFGKSRGGKMIEEGKKVKIDYVLTIDGQVVDSSKDKEPLQYIDGQGSIIPGLEKELKGLKEGDEKKVSISPEGAYGPIKEDALKEIPKTSLPQGLTPQVGMPMQVQNGDKTFVVKIAQIKDDTVVLDLNHPLAGKTLNFDIKVMSVE